MPVQRLSTALSGLVNEDARRSSALELAHLLGCDRVLVSVSDALGRSAAPMSGLPWPTLRRSEWIRIRKESKADAISELAPRDPNTGIPVAAVVVRGGDGTILVAVGGKPRRSRLRALRPLIAMLGAAVRAASAQPRIADLHAEIANLSSTAQTAGRLKDDFLATLSHELRTPLNAMLGWIQLLRLHIDEPEERTHALDVIERNARMQVQLVADLLDVSRVITGQMRITFERVDLAEIVRYGVEALVPTARAKSVDLHLVVDDLHGVVYGDPARLQQLVWNLVSNAVKFTPPGGRVDVYLRAHRSSVEIAVVDTGIGIRPELLPHLFERFRQGDSSLTREFGGLGLGLAIVRHLVELHGGSVEAASEGPDKGSTFIARLPIRPSDTRRHALERTGSIGGR